MVSALYLYYQRFNLASAIFAMPLYLLLHTCAEQFLSTQLLTALRSNRPAFLYIMYRYENMPTAADPEDPDIDSVTTY